MRKLHDHQQLALTELKRSLGQGKKHPMIQAPTGFGKTVLAAEIVRGCVAKGNRIIFSVPAISLIDQTVESFAEHGIFDVGVLQGNHPMTNYEAPVQVASVQTLARRRIPHADVVVIDEAHRWYKFYGEWMARWNATPFVGLSATPWTKGLGKHFDDLIIAATTEELIEKGFLSPFRVYAPAHPDLSKVKIRAGDYAEDQLAEVMNEKTLVADIVSTWRKFGEDRPTFCFCVDRAHAKHVQECFQAAGVPCGYIDSYTPREERLEQFDAFQRKELKIISSVGCLTTGVDLDVRCIILARPTKSEMLFTQIIGRGLRTAEGKENCLILDHSDTHLRLGFVTDIHHTKLDDGKERKKPEQKPKEKLPKECPSCSYLKPPKVHVCPACGFVPRRETDLEAANGELEELSEGKGKKLSKAEREELYSGLLWHAREKGFNLKWADHKFREKNGVWPNKYNYVKPAEPVPWVKSYIKYLTIAYAKSKKGKAA